jgi:hypothetical protein
MATQDLVVKADACVKPGFRMTGGTCHEESTFVESTLLMAAKLSVSQCSTMAKPRKLPFDTIEVSMVVAVDFHESIVADQVPLGSRPRRAGESSAGISVMTHWR